MREWLWMLTSGPGSALMGAVRVKAVGRLPVGEVMLARAW